MPDWFVAFFTLLLVYVTNRLVTSTNKLWEAGEEQARLARDEFNANHRPWISIESMKATSSLLIDDGGAHVTVEFTLKNVGNSPAVNVMVIPEMHATLHRGFGIEELKNICAQQKTDSPEIGSFGHTLFPGQPFPVEIPLHIPAQIIDALRPKEGARRPKLFGPAIVGCVNYKFTFAAGHHQTGFIFILRKHNPKNSGGRLFVVQDGAVPVADLITYPSYVGSFAD